MEYLFPSTKMDNKRIGTSIHMIGTLKKDNDYGLLSKVITSQTDSIKAITPGEGHVLPVRVLKINNMAMRETNMTTNPDSRTVSSPFCKEYKSILRRYGLLGDSFCR